MTKLRAGLLIAVGVLLLVAVTGGTIFYVKIYRPIASPLMTMTGARALEERRLQNHAEFVPPESGELSAEQAANFVAVEETVHEELAAGAAVLARHHAGLLQAYQSQLLTTQATLLAFSDMKATYLKAKMAQIDAMNRANFSKQEFEWVRRQLYAAAGLRLSQLDVSDLLAGVPDATVEVRQFESAGRVPRQNEPLGRSLAPKLQAWVALGFFGL